MAKVTDFYFNSSNNVNRIRVRSWEPEIEQPIAVLQLAHGIIEHIERYDDFASFLADKGFLVVGNDHLGHGLSTDSEEQYGFFADKDGWNCVVKDIHQLHQMTVQQYPDLPYFLMGHSMGSFLMRTYLIDYPQPLSGVILSGTGQPAAPILKAGLAVIKTEGTFGGLKKRSKLAHNLCIGAYNKKFKPNRTDSDWLSRDENIVDIKLADPACNFIPTLSCYGDMLRGLCYIGKKENMLKMDKSTPVFFFAGDSDPVGDMGKAVKKLYSDFLDAGMRHVRIKLYAGGRHEMLNEINKEQVYDDILSWLKQQM